MRSEQREVRGTGEEAGLAAESAAPRKGGATSKCYSAAEKRPLLDEFVKGIASIFTTAASAA